MGIFNRFEVLPPPGPAFSVWYGPNDELSSQLPGRALGVCTSSKNNQQGCLKLGAEVAGK